MNYINCTTWPKLEVFTHKFFLQFSWAYLTILAWFSSIPATVLPTRADKRWMPAQQDVQDHAQTPEVALLVVHGRLEIVDECLCDLRRHELGRADGGEELGGGDGGVVLGAEVDAAAQAKVADLDGGNTELALTQDVLRFEVTMSNAWWEGRGQRKSEPRLHRYGLPEASK